MLCKHCGSYRAGPREDCDNGACTMNCGPAVIDVRGILDAAKHAHVTEDQAVAIRDAMRGMKWRHGLFDLWYDRCRKEEK